MHELIERVVSNEPLVHLDGHPRPPSSLIGLADESENTRRGPGSWDGFASSKLDGDPSQAGGIPPVPGKMMR